MAGSRGIWLEFRAVCNRNMLLHTVCGCELPYQETRYWGKETFLKLYSYTLLWLHCILNSVKDICKSSWSKKTFLSSYNDAATVFQDSGGDVLYSIHDRHFGITDEYFMSWRTGIQPEMLLAVDTIHDIALTPMPRYVSSPWNVNVKIWDFVDVSWKGKLRNRNRERQSDCLTNKCWYIF